MLLNLVPNLAVTHFPSAVSLVTHTWLDKSKAGLLLLKMNNCEKLYTLH